MSVARAARGAGMALMVGLLAAGSARAAGPTIDHYLVQSSGGTFAECGDVNNEANTHIPDATGSGKFSVTSSINPASSSASCGAGSASDSTAGTSSSKGEIGSGLTFTQSSSGTTTAVSNYHGDPQNDCIDVGLDISTQTTVDFTIASPMPYTFKGTLSHTSGGFSSYSLIRKAPDSATIFDQTKGLSPDLKGTIPAGSYEYSVRGSASNDLACDKTGSASDSYSFDVKLKVGGDPVIFVPGFLGSKIFCGGAEAWTNLPRPNYPAMTLGSDGVSDRGCGPLGSQLAFPYDSTVKFVGDQFGDDGSIYAWDWRKNPELAIAGLDQFVERARCGGDLPAGETTCQHPVSDKVVLMAHSFGGLLVRLYLDNPAQAAKVDRVVTIGTPYWGSPKALFPFAYGIETPEFSGLDLLSPNAELKAFARYLTGLFFLWPSPHYRGWLTVQGRSPAPLDQAGELSLVRDLGGNPDLLASAWTVHSSVLDALPSSSDPEYETVVGSGVHTIGTVSIAPGLAGPSTDLVTVRWVNGDGTVPLISAEAATPAAQRHYVCGVAHSALSGDASVDQRIEAFLTSGDAIDDTPGAGVGLCPAAGYSISAYSLSAAGFPSADRVAVDAGAAGTMSLLAAEQAGLIDVIDTGHQLLIATSTMQPLSLSLPVTGVALRIAPMTNGRLGRVTAYEPVGRGTLTIALGGGPVTVRLGGKRVLAGRDDHTPPRTSVKLTRRGRRYVLRFTVRDSSPTVTYVRVGKHVLRVRRSLTLSAAQLRRGVLIQSIDAFGNREKPRRVRVR